MARVVQRRTSPPYLLILFVMLFLTATVLTFVFYNKYSKEAERRRAAEDEARDAQTRLRKCENEDVQPLVKVMLMQPAAAGATAGAVSAAEDALQLKYAQKHSGGLVAAVRGMNEDIRQLREVEITGLNQQIASNNAKHQAELDKKDKLIRDLEAKRAENEAALKKAAADLAKAVADEENQMTKAVADKDAIIAERNKQIQLQNQTIEDLKREITKRDGVIAQQKHRIAELTGRRTPETASRPDGKVVKYVPEQALVYLSLGRKDGVRLGLPFAVHSSQAPVTEKTLKARVVVTNVLENTCECRVMEQLPDDPILEGDPVVNLAFDAGRVHKFVVEGEFDLQGKGRPDPLANSRIRGLIQKWGGQVVDSVTIDTDYIVMGAEPQAPSKPAADAPAHEWELYRQALAKYERYDKVRALAREYNVEILNTTRFLAFSGYAPRPGVIE